MKPEDIVFPVYGVCPKNASADIMYGVYGSLEDAYNASLANKEHTVVVCFRVQTVDFIGEMDLTEFQPPA
jgi:hypothetical protein